MPNTGWKGRLLAAIRASGRSMRSISLEADLSPGYLNNMFADEKEPTVASLVAVCKVLGISAAEILDGHAVSPQTEELLDHWTRLSKEGRQALLEFLATQRAMSKR